MTPVDTALVEREQQEADALAKVQAWEVATAADYSALDAFISGLASLIRAIKEDFRESKQKADEAHKAIVAQEKAHLDRAEKARALGKSKLLAWRDAEDTKRQKEEERQRAEAKHLAEEAALREAERLQQAGDHEAAEAVVAQAASAPAPEVQVASSVPKGATIFQTRWSAVVTDPLFVLKALEQAGNVLAKAKTPEGKAAYDILRQAYVDAKYMIYDTAALGRQAVATKDALVLGGVRFVSKKV